MSRLNNAAFASSSNPNGITPMMQKEVGTNTAMPLGLC